MAYNRKNVLNRIIDIQTITLQHTSQGVTQKFVYENYIKPVYHISRATYYQYLGTNAKRDLKQLFEIEKQQTQLNLFNNDSSN